MRHHHGTKKTSILYSISIIGFLSALHLSLPNFFNSSFLSLFTDEKTISLVYFIISLLTIFGFLSMNTILRRFGNLRTSLTLIMLQILVFYGLLTTDSPSFIFIFFILAMSIISLIGLTIDVFLQKNTESEHTGSTRGFFMTSINTAWILGPFIGGMLISDTNYSGVYITAFILLFPLLYLVHKNFKNYRDPHYENVSIRQTISRILEDPDITKIFIINIVLQVFYAWMTIYTPIYLYQHLGFSWSEISIMFTIMLIPFVLVDLPLGKLADKKWGEKEMLLIGFLIMGIATSALVLFPFKSFVVWSIMLFITRIGAATAEVMIETYFFKKIDGRDPEILSMFRTTRPLSYFLAPVLTIVGLIYTTDSYLFLLLGIMCLLVIYPISTIKDTN